ncbi:MAG: hypothetical protein ACRYE8_05445 [Janthinobacterium lividum]
MHGSVSPVIPRLDRGIHLKILKLLVLKVVFWIPWSSHGMTPITFFDPRGQCLAEMTYNII